MEFLLRITSPSSLEASGLDFLMQIPSSQAPQRLLWQIILCHEQRSDADGGVKLKDIYLEEHGLGQLIFSY